MELWLTEGMFGRKIRLLVETDNVKTILEKIFMWKSDLDNMRKYKIEKYDRFAFRPEDNCTAVDFGDYSTFMLISGKGSQTLFKEEADEDK